MVTTNYQTYRQKGIREDLSNEIYDISPMEVPFFSMLKRGPPAKNTKVEWQTDALASASGTNKAIEGANVTLLTATPSARLGNYTQIWVKGIQVSGTANAVTTAGREQELAYQIAKRGKEIKRDMETNLCGNYASSAGTSAAARASAGFEAWITTNSTYGGTAGITDGANGGYTAAGTVSVAVDGSSSNLRTVTEAIFKASVRSAWTAGGQPTIVIVGPINKQRYSAFAGLTTKYTDFGNPSSSSNLVVVGAADIYLSDFGKLKIVPNRFSRERTSMIIDPDYWAIRYLRPFQVFDIGKLGDSEIKQMLCEATLQSSNQAASAKIADQSS